MTTFDPGSIPKYCVIGLPHRFQEGDYAQRKLFVVLGHRKGYALCLKATSRVEMYRNNKDAMAGVVYYRGGEITAFPEDTAIQADNCVPIPHGELSEAKANGRLEIREVLPEDFENRLRRAVDNSVTLDNLKRKRLCDLLGFTT